MRSCSLLVEWQELPLAPFARQIGPPVAQFPSAVKPLLIELPYHEQGVALVRNPLFLLEPPAGLEPATY